MDIEKIILTDEEGNEEEFGLVATFGVDEQDYAALEPLNSDDELIYLFRMQDDEGDGVLFFPIEDEEEMDSAVEIFEDLLEEMVEDEE